jgi:sortase A
MSSNDQDNLEPAVNIARAKLAKLYQEEPDAKAEIVEASTTAHRSKHQRYMHSLSTSGKSLAEIQTAWHNYYIGLPDKEKHDVWQEFYAAHDKSKAAAPQAETPPAIAPEAHPTPAETHHKPPKPQSVAAMKQRIIRSANSGRKASKKQHLHSMFFGLGMGALVMLFLLFGFFNERFVAPFITPSRAVSSTPIIVDPNSTVAGPEPEIIIPKINVEIPVVYDVAGTNEADIQHALERGVVHYSTTPMPGQKGNSVIVGHSSNNIFNQGKYKFAFVLLSKLEIGDTFYLTKDGVRYAYKIYEKKIVPPSDVSVLGPNDKTATATLITCDPPGTSINRLIVVGEQISPDPNGNAASTADPAAGEASGVVPGNAPSLWSRITNLIN